MYSTYHMGRNCSVSTNAKELTRADNNGLIGPICKVSTSKMMRPKGATVSDL